MKTEQKKLMEKELRKVKDARAYNQQYRLWRVTGQRFIEKILVCGTMREAKKRARKVGGSLAIEIVKRYKAHPSDFFPSYKSVSTQYFNI